MLLTLIGLWIAFNLLAPATLLLGARRVHPSQHGLFAKHLRGIGVFRSGYLEAMAHASAIGPYRFIVVRSDIEHWQWDVVVAHEIGHLHHHHPWKRMVANLFLIGFLPWRRRWINRMETQAWDYANNHLWRNP